MILAWVLLLVLELGGGPEFPYAGLQQAKAVVQQVPFSHGGAECPGWLSVLLLVLELGGGV